MDISTLLYCKVGQTSRSSSPGTKLWYVLKDMVTGNAHEIWEADIF